MGFSHLDQLLGTDRILKILRTEYIHRRMRNGDDLYMTEYGWPFLTRVLMENWHRSEEYEKLRERLSGSGTIYRVHIQRILDERRDIVIKWSRMGQDIPGHDMENMDEMANAEFNSPFEEISFVMEMRNTRFESPGMIRTHKPLGIYVPFEHTHPELMGRKTYKFNSKAREQGIELDLFRQYIVIYEWVKGIDAVEASEKIKFSDEDLKQLTLHVEEDLRKKGFRDRDRKPRHIIVRPMHEDSLEKDKRGNVLYAYVDFELLERTPEREKWVMDSRRAEYLRRQRDRFNPKPKPDFPAHLKSVEIFGVEYVFGRAESTGGALWVVGKDPVLFDYFLPELWRRTPSKKLSHANQLYYTTTKDNIHLVWRVSRVGEKPDVYGFDEKGQEILDHGHNSPFEEFALALELSRRGLPAIYPRAIYRTGHQTEASEYIADDRRYETHKPFVMPDGLPILEKQYSYIALWGYWNGPDELLAVRDGDYYTGISLSNAFREGIISKEMFDEVIQAKRERLREAGVEDLNFQADHFLISFDHTGKLVPDKDGKPELRVCNFELFKRI